MMQVLKVFFGLVLVVLLSFLIVGSTRAAEDPQVVHVTLQDNRMILSQTVVAPGKLIKFVVTNASSKPHQFVVEPYARAPGAYGKDQPVVAPGTTWTIQRTLGTGVYRVTCTNPAHAERGFEAALSADLLPKVNFPMPMEFIVSVMTLVLGVAYIVGDSLGFHITRA